VPGLGTSFGRGGATTFSTDMQFADSFLIMGSNMAECHPVAFRWVMAAKTRPNNPAKVIHADPRFTRTSAMANTYAPVRAGTDIAFLGGVIKYILDKHAPVFDKPESQRSSKEKFHADYLLNYTNAPTLISEDFKDTEEDNFAGIFSGFDPRERKYNQKKWRYAAEPAKPGGGPDKDKKDDHPREGGTPQEGKPHSFSAQVGKLVGPEPTQDRTLKAPNCVFHILQRHYARYTPELVEQVCGTPRDIFQKVCETLYENSGPDRTGAICYAVGWTQHTVGVQMIRAAAVVQLLLGNIGRPGGGILALRGHATIQGSTDIATLYNLLPGYINPPSALRKHDTLSDYFDVETSATSFWSNLPAFFVSQLKAWFGDDATPENNFAYDYLPRITADHSHLPVMVEMSAGRVKGMMALGQNPAVGGQNASFQRQALAKLDWLVVRDLYETETASFWKDSPEVKNGTLKPESIQTEVFFLPAAAVAEMDGSFTNTHRLVQWHEKAVDPSGDCRSDIWFTVHLGLKLKELYKGSKEKRDRPIQALVWDYIDEEENRPWRIKDEPSASLIMKEINGYKCVVDGKKMGLKEAPPLSYFSKLKDDPSPGYAPLDDGTTACGAWIYTGIYAPPAEQPKGTKTEDAKGRPPVRYGGVNRAASRMSDDWVSLNWGFSWPANRRILYNRCSADPDGNPWPKEARLAQEHGPRNEDGSPKHKGYVYWDAKAVNKATGKPGNWVGLDVPDFVAGKAPSTEANPKGVGVATHDGKSPFIMKADGKGWLFVPNGLVDGPMPTHYEPYESPVQNIVYKQQFNPPAIVWTINAPAGQQGNTYAPVGSPDYPHVLSTYRLTEHHLSGSMSRWLPWLAELMPELFCEISPELAAEIGVRNTEYVKISTPRATIRAKALVTRRIRPFRLKEKVVHHVGLPWHWGYKGLTTGDVANDLTALVADPNVTIHEGKVFVCNVTKG
jgi:formate dehydrogenase major subunit